MSEPILPGAVIGVLGSGQLGRMFAIAARRMGYRVHTFSPDADTPTGQVADEEIIAPYEDLDAVRDFASRVSVVTFEFENVPSATAAAAAERAVVRPEGGILHITQNRLREKAFLSRHGFPLAPYGVVTGLGDLQETLERLGCPAILKTAGFGYDGKGQVRISSPQAALPALAAMNGSEAVLEKRIDFEMELSVVAVRALNGHFTWYGPIRNEHDRGILDVSSAPSGLPPDLSEQAIEISRGVCEMLGLVGVLCVEFFLTRDGQLLINELAPRPHNSGHLTFDACLTSQFEQQLRAVCGLPLGSTELLRPAAMANVLGDLWRGGEPDWEAACSYPEVKLHLYGKTEPRPGRKMGHITVLADTVSEALDVAIRARGALVGQPDRS